MVDPLPDPDRTQNRHMKRSTITLCLLATLLVVVAVYKASQNMGSDKEVVFNASSGIKTFVPSLMVFEQ